MTGHPSAPILPSRTGRRTRIRLGSILPVLLAAAACAPRAAAGRGVENPPPLPAPIRWEFGPQAIRVCMVEGGKLVDGIATYDVRTGDTTFAPPGQPAGTSTSYAAGAPWYIENEPITVGGSRYVKYGTPRVVPREELVRAGEFGGVPLFAERASAGTPEALYVPFRPGCEFHRYLLEPMLSGVRG